MRNEDTNWCGSPSSFADLLDIVNVCDKFDVPVIADGGIRYIGDVCKGLRLWEKDWNMLICYQI